MLIVTTPPDLTALRTSGNDIIADYYYLVPILIFKTHSLKWVHLRWYMSWAYNIVLG